MSSRSPRAKSVRHRWPHTYAAHVVIEHRPAEGAAPRAGEISLHSGQWRSPPVCAQCMSTTVDWINGTSRSVDKRALFKQNGDKGPILATQWPLSIEKESVLFQLADQHPSIVRIRIVVPDAAPSKFRSIFVSEACAPMRHCIREPRHQVLLWQRRTRSFRIANGNVA